MVCVRRVFSSMVMVCDILRHTLCVCVLLCLYILMLIVVSILYGSYGWVCIGLIYCCVLRCRVVKYKECDILKGSLLLPSEEVRYKDKIESIVKNVYMLYKCPVSISLVVETVCHGVHSDTMVRELLEELIGEGVLIPCGPGYIQPADKYSRSVFE